MFLEMFSIWRNTVQGIAQISLPPSSLRRIGILLAKQKALWTFIVLFEPSPYETLFCHLVIKGHVDRRPFIQPVGQEQIPINALSLSDFLKCITRALEEEGAQFVEELLSAILSSWNQLEIEGAQVVSKWVQVIFLVS